MFVIKNDHVFSIKTKSGVLNSTWLFHRNNGKELARKLRSVCSELMQSADILDGGLNDVSVFFDEVKKTKCSSYGDWRYHCKDYKEHLESNGSKKEEA